MSVFSHSSVLCLMCLLASDVFQKATQSGRGDVTVCWYHNRMLLGFTFIATLALL